MLTNYTRTIPTHTKYLHAQVYNLHALGSQPPTELHETKGCLMYSISEQTNMLCVVSKRKLSFFALKGKAAFAHTGDLALPETPRMVFASDLGVVVGFRKSFDYIDFDTMQQTRLVDGDKDRCRMLSAYTAPAPAPFTNTRHNSHYIPSVPRHTTHSPSRITHHTPHITLSSRAHAHKGGQVHRHGTSCDRVQRCVSAAGAPTAGEVGG